MVEDSRWPWSRILLIIVGILVAVFILPTVFIVLIGPAALVVIHTFAR